MSECKVSMRIIRLCTWSAWMDDRPLWLVDPHSDVQKWYEWL